MVQFILAATGGYLIGDAIKSNTIKYDNGGEVKGIVKAKPITYTIDYYPLESAENWLTQWQMDRWIKQGISKEQIDVYIKKAKKEIKNVTERTPFTTWFLEIPKNVYDFSVLEATYKIKKETRKVQVDIGWKTLMQNKTYWTVEKTNNVESPFDSFIVTKRESEKKDSIIKDINWKFQSLIYENDISNYPLPI